MVTNSFKRLFALTLAVSALMAVLAAPANAQSQDRVQVPATRTIGVLDTDGTALYSVLFESVSDPLGNLTISSSLPANTTFVEAVSAPTGATFAAAPDGKSVSWQFASLDA